MRVLLIEDEDHIREVARLSLEMVGGWEVLAAGGGVEGLALARDEQPDVILLDVMMPDMDGPRTLGALRGDEQTCDIPVVFLTAKVQGEERRELTELGAVGVIAKPFDPMRLPAEVAALLDWQL